MSFQVESTYALKKIVGQKVPIVTMLHGHPSVYCDKLSIPGVKDAVESSAVVQVLRPEFVECLLAYYPLANAKVIPNCVPQFSEIAELKKKTVINVARLSPEKRQVLLTKAFALIKDQFPDWNLEFWGELHVNTQFTAELEKTIKECGVEDRVHLCGATSDVPKQLERASIFAFPSEFEGWGLALTEAMSIGLPAIGCKECPAVNTLIRDEENGLLCDDTPESLAAALSRLMSDESLRIRFGKAAKEDMKKYAPDRIWDQWENLLLSLTESK